MDIDDHAHEIRFDGRRLLERLGFSPTLEASLPSYRINLRGDSPRR
jgi:hypothetical protein